MIIGLYGIKQNGKDTCGKLFQKHLNNFEIVKITKNDDFGNEATVYFRNKNINNLILKYRLKMNYIS